MNDRTRLLLEMKRSAGLASRAELDVLDNSVLLIGGTGPNSGPLAVLPPCRTLGEWTARYGGARYETFAEMSARNRETP